MYDIILKSSRFLLLPFRPPRSLLIRSYSSWREEMDSKWNNPEEMYKARQWVDSFKLEDIPKKACVLTFSTSSGPGGQNVNKLSTKATLHLKLSSPTAQFLPDYIMRKVRENSRHLTKNDEIVLQEDGSRKQSQNSEECFKRLYKILLSSVQKDLPGVTSTETKKRVERLKKQDERRRRVQKESQKSKKANRRKRGDD